MRQISLCTFASSLLPVSYFLLFSLGCRDIAILCEGWMLNGDNSVSVRKWSCYLSADRLACKWHLMCSYQTIVTWRGLVFEGSKALVDSSLRECDSAKYGFLKTSPCSPWNVWMSSWQLVDSSIVWRTISEPLKRPLQASLEVGLLEICPQLLFRLKSEWLPPLFMLSSGVFCWR